MKKILAVAAIAGLAGLTACSVSTPAPDSTTSTAAPATSSSAPSRATPSASGSVPASGTSGVKEACEKFNSLFAEYRTAEPTSDAYEAIYSKAWKAKDDYTGNLRGLFSSLSALTISHSAVVEKDGQPDQAAKDAVRDAVFANANECSAAGVTLTL
ncbi:hypothetical protein TV39_15450 [Arthrobacter sp. SPG23]|uniref:hypothetical protein n=1 Tax=Arthrobacter sp. SPG23 TaxID=1610703 RepID=UPI0005BDA4C6|nr:hypothetical protein [Arthrobacter sp. SPG23]KIS26661.1 hypothetical protein TV39_15450 [Arthrobacter sp. SPG23]